MVYVKERRNLSTCKFSSNHLLKHVKDMRAVDSIDRGSGLSISNDGELMLRCDKQVSLSGSSVNNGGVLTVKGEKVVLSNGFSVKAGGSLSINDI